MSDANEIIQSMLNRPYMKVHGDQHKKYICWDFCKEIYSLFDMKLHHFFHQRQLKRIDKSQILSIVLFHIGSDWHSGVVWPDGLHFIHASTKNIFDPTEKDYIVSQNRLTIWPYNMLIEGYYAP